MDDRKPAEETAPTRGHLKIFLGAAPGVGKTFAMLESACERQHAGARVLAGLVDTHGRPEAEVLLRELDRLPAAVTAAGVAGTISSLDVDAIIARRPDIVLVDDLAHVNPPGGRHAARYHDVDELLDAGIGVYTTLSIQHLASLSDVVERIAGVRPTVTVPDSVLHRADEIEVVDLSPDDLLSRLAEGKVHVPESSSDAVSALFSRGKLTALRELALREAALRVDAQMLDFLRSDEIQGPLPTHDRILVCVGQGEEASRLVRTAKRVADRRGAPWVAVYIETHHHHGIPAEAKQRINDALRLASQLGGETRILHSDEVAGELLDYALAHNISLIIVGRQRRRRLRRPLLARAIADELLARAGEVDVLVVGRGEDEMSPRRWKLSVQKQRVNWGGVLATLTGVAAVTAACWYAGSWLPSSNVAVAYLLMVLLIAMRLGLRHAIVASVASFLAFNFFFTEPRLTFAVDNAANAITLLFFLAAAVITSNLAGRVRRQMRAMKASARRTATLYEFSRKIAGAAMQDDVLWAVVHHVAAAVRGRSLVLLPRGEDLEIAAGYPPEDRLDDNDWEAARTAWTRSTPTGRGAATLPSAGWLFLPLSTTRGPVGVLGMQAEGDEDALPSPEQSRLLEALADQTALALERTALFADVEAARIAGETERLRTALLSSLQEELRAPIDGILEDAGRLAAAGEMSRSQRRERALSIQDEAERLNRFIRNLQDMTRLGAGALQPRPAPTALTDVLAAALERAKRIVKDRRLQIDVDPSMPTLLIDPVLIEQVFFNLIDNACKYSPADSRITVWARQRDDKVLIEVSDEGPGIPEADRAMVFDIFYRVEGETGSSATGLGLAVCRGIVEAHGGRIRVESGLNDVGASICFQLPVHTPLVPVAVPAA